MASTPEALRTVGGFYTGNASEANTAEFSKLASARASAMSGDNFDAGEASFTVKRSLIELYCEPVEEVTPVEMRGLLRDHVVYLQTRKPIGESMVFAMARWMRRYSARQRTVRPTTKRQHEGLESDGRPVAKSPRKIGEAPPPGPSGVKAPSEELVERVTDIIAGVSSATIVAVRDELDANSPDQALQRLSGECLAMLIEGNWLLPFLVAHGCMVLVGDTAQDTAKLLVVQRGEQYSSVSPLPSSTPPSPTHGRAWTEPWSAPPGQARGACQRRWR
jgi:hypothetical protein